MHYKIEGAIRRNRKYFILFLILWVFSAIVLVSPLSYSWQIAKNNGNFDLTQFLTLFSVSITHPFSTFFKLFSSGTVSGYFSALLVFSIFYGLFFFIGVARSAPKNEYTDIEHGSSDWSQKGEQYQVLNKTKGIILGENNYLPVDKRGNINVLVVGRIRFW